MKLTKSPFTDIIPQYIVDKKGKKVSVVLEIHAFEKLIEDLEDIYFGSLAKAALEKDQETISHAMVRRKVTGK